MRDRDRREQPASVRLRGDASLVRARDPNCSDAYARLVGHPCLHSAELRWLGKRRWRDGEREVVRAGDVRARPQFEWRSSQPGEAQREILYSAESDAMERATSYEESRSPRGPCTHLLLVCTASAVRRMSVRGVSMASVMRASPACPLIDARATPTGAVVRSMCRAPLQCRVLTCVENLMHRKLV